MYRYTFESCMIEHGLPYYPNAQNESHPSSKVLSMHYINSTYTLLANMYEKSEFCFNLSGSISRRFNTGSNAKDMSWNTELVQLYYNSLQRCFGNEFRKASLGLRHLDKSIYFDQLSRWLINFHPSQFRLISSEEMLLNPLGTVENVLSFISSKPLLLEQMRSLSSMDTSTRHLERPNKLSRNVKLSLEEERELRRYLTPYQDALQRVLCYFG